MPRFSQVSESRLITVHPALQKPARHLVREFDISVLPDGGWRSPMRQLELYEQGRSKVMAGGRHNHTRRVDGQDIPWSQAIDIAPFPIDFGQTPKQILAAYLDTKMRAEDMARLAKQLTKANTAISRFYYMAGRFIQICDTLNIEVRWGGDWDSDNDFFDQTFNDLGHFELAGQALEDDLYDGSY